MLFDLPDHATLYDAILTRNPGYDGRAFVCVTSTGIFCRLNCPARTPKPENCRFVETVSECIELGFRPCKRCHPLGPAAEADPAVQALLEALAGAPSRRWNEVDISQMGYDPSTIRRIFKRHFGTTFLEMARAVRLKNGFETLSLGGRVIDAQLDAGFSSPNAFRLAFARLLGMRPADFAKDAMLKADWFDTPLGTMIAVSDTTHLHLLEFANRKALPTELKKLRDAVKGAIGIGRFAPSDQIEAELSDFFAGINPHFQTRIALHGTPFTKRVWYALQDIPAGKTRSYSDIARIIGRPSATRAVAQANGANQLAIIIPCHRVIGVDGALTGYGGGLWRKQKLIEIELKYFKKEN